MRPSASSVANPNPFLSRVKQTYGIKAAKKLHFKNDLENNCRYEESDYVTKNNAVKVLHSICQQIWKTQQWPQDWEKSVFIPIPKKGNAKECSNYHTIVLISHASKVCSKFSKRGFSNTWTVNFLMFKLDLEKAEEHLEVLGSCTVEAWPAEFWALLC